MARTRWVAGAPFRAWLSELRVRLIWTTAACAVLACQTTVNQTVVGAGGADGSASGGQSSGGASYSEMVLSDGPSLYWRELAATGRVPDLSPKHNDGDVSGCVQSAQGSAGSVIRLCGGYVYAGDIFDFADTAPFTFEAWIKPIDVQQAEFARIAGKENPVSGPRQGWDLIAIGWQADGGVPALAFERWHSTDGSEAASGTKLINPTLPPATFTHVAITYDSTTCRIYFNGASAAEESSTGPLPDTTGTFRVGASPFGSNWLGDIAEIAVYEKALLADRISAHYNRGKAQGY